MGHTGGALKNISIGMQLNGKQDGELATSASKEKLGVYQRLQASRSVSDETKARAFFRVQNGRPLYPARSFCSFTREYRWIPEYRVLIQARLLLQRDQFVMPVQRHTNLDAVILANRTVIYQAASAHNS